MKREYLIQRRTSCLWLCGRFHVLGKLEISRCQPLPVSTAGYELEWDTGLTTPHLSDACMNFHPNPSWNAAVIKTNPEVIFFGCFGFSCIYLSLDCLEYPDVVLVASRILPILSEPPAGRLECAPIWGHLGWVRKCCWGWVGAEWMDLYLIWDSTWTVFGQLWIQWIGCNWMGTGGEEGVLRDWSEWHDLTACTLARRAVATLHSNHTDSPHPDVLIWSLNLRRPAQNKTAWEEAAQLRHTQKASSSHLFDMDGALIHLNHESSRSFSSIHVTLYAECVLIDAVWMNALPCSTLRLCMRVHTYKHCIWLD